MLRSTKQIVGIGCFFLVAIFTGVALSLTKRRPSEGLRGNDIVVNNDSLQEGGVHVVDTIIDIPPIKSVHYLDEAHMHPEFDRHPVFRMPEDSNDYAARWKLQKRTFDNNTVIITVANLGHVNFTLNAAESIRRQGRLDNFFVLCLDLEICEVLHDQGINGAMIPDHWAKVGLQEGVESEDISGEAKFGTNTRYLSVTYIKQVVVWRLLQWGFQVIFTDADIVWVKPGVTDYLKVLLEKMPTVDYLGSVEYGEPNLLLPYVNSGFYFVRPSPIILKFFELVVANQIHGPKVVSQKIFNKGLDVLGMKANGRNSHKAYYLNNLLFCNGWDYFFQRSPQQLDLVPYTVHPNFLVGEQKKTDALKSAGLWLI